jgi:hypothetical protein
MLGETPTRRGQLKGYMFEVVIRHLLKLNNFEQITTSVPGKIQVTSDHKIEIKGRGTWHQIDSPCVYIKSIPFIYDIRLLAEVKFYSSEIQKSKIREYVGTIKDISENYFIDSKDTIDNQRRYTDIGVFFAINGFQIESENLAFVHGIKTISYKNNSIMNKIKPILERIESECLRAELCISNGNQKKFMDDLTNLLLYPSQSAQINDFNSYFTPTGEFAVLLNQLSSQLLGIQSSFFGVTGTNYFIHFLSFDTFPQQLFMRTDERECRIYYDVNDATFYLRILNENGVVDSSKFYFSAPKPILDKVFDGGTSVLDDKGRHFSIIKISISIDDINRNLVLRLDNDWIERIKQGRQHEANNNKYYQENNIYEMGTNYDINNNINSTHEKKVLAKQGVQVT